LLWQSVVEEKQNEIVAIPDLLDEINIRNCIITIDAMGTHKKIVDKIISKKADYVLALKGNQGELHKNVVDYFDDPKFNEKIKKDGGYRKKALEKLKKHRNC
jgi:predicted transposase YbfD/YdcC